MMSIESGKLFAEDLTKALNMIGFNYIKVTFSHQTDCVIVECPKKELYEMMVVVNQMQYSPYYISVQKLGFFSLLKMKLMKLMEPMMSLELHL